MKLKISILAVIALTVVSCLKNDINWNSDDAEFRPWEINNIPIINVHVPLYKTMNKQFDDNLFINEKGVICIKYTHSENIGWDNDIGIRSASSYDNPWTPIPFPAGTINITAPTFNVHLWSSGEVGSYVKEAVLTTGNISFIIESANRLRNGSRITITIPELTNEEGEVFTETITLPSSGESYPLEGYTIRTDDDNNFNVTLNINGSASASGNLNIQFEISELDVSYMSGYFGRMQHRKTYEIRFDFFNDLDFDGTFGFRDIKMDAVVSNRAGLPMDIAADVYFVNESGLNKKANLSPPFEFPVSSATESDSNHTVTPSVKTFSTVTSEIEFENGIFPSKLKFDVTGTGNSNSNPYTDENFIVKDKNGNDALAKVNFNLVVPLYVKIGEFSRSDIVPFDYNNIINDNENFSSDVDNIAVNLSIVNNLPFEIKLSAIAVDAAGKPVETILFENNINSAKETQNISIPLIKSQLNRFRAEEVKSIILYSYAKTPNVSYVEVKEDASLDIAVSMDFKGAILNIF